MKTRNQHKEFSLVSVRDIVLFKDFSWASIHAIIETMNGENVNIYALKVFMSSIIANRLCFHFLFLN